MKYKIPVSKPNLTKSDLEEIKKCFNSSWISSKSPWVEKFEKEFAKKISKTKYAVAVNSGTSALFLALKALKIGIDDEVILPAFTMIATINAVVWVGAKPILVDCQSKQDWNINPDKIEEKITKKTKAIIPVHIYGYPCDMEKIIEIAKKYHLYVVEDAAEAMGSTFRGKNCGSFSDVSCFSLYSNKIITTGNGGIVCTNNKKVYNLIKRLSFFDFNKKTHFKHKLIGYNLVLSGIQASLGYSQIKRFNKLLKKRRQVFYLYKKNLKNKNVRFINPVRDSDPNYWFPAIIARNKALKDKIVKRLVENKIEIRGFFRPIHLQPVYKNHFQRQEFPLSEYFYQRGLLLPSYFDLKENEIKYICNLISR